MRTNQVTRDRQKNCRGFTLIEVIAVLIILGIVAAVIVSRMTTTASYSIKSQAEVLKGHIRYAQSLAMATDSIWGINISDSKQYSLFKGTTGTTVILPGAGSNPVVLDAAGPSLSTGIIYFGSRGRPVDALGNSITPAPITVSMTGEPNEVINIEANTGFIQ